MTQKLSLQQARKLALHSQNVFSSETFGRGINATLQAIRHLGYVQIDTISVVARAHHHTLWNRTSDYQPDHLLQLQHDGKIFEYWSHAASFLPIEDYRFCLPRMHSFANGSHHWFEKNSKLTKEVLARIREEGPLQAKDFEYARKKSATWWDWKPAKKALEQLYMEGKLMAVRGQNFQKVYDLTERLLPEHIDTTLPTQTELAGYLIMHFLNAHGIGQAKEMVYLRKGMLVPVRQALADMTEAGEVVSVSVNGQVWYCLPDALVLASKPLPRKSLKILSPFDNLLIQRKRLKTLFDFDYQIECYVPEAKRKYGYFCLPLFWNGLPVGRMDVKAVRAEKVLLVRNLVLEPGFKVTDIFIQAFAAELKRFAGFNDCEILKVEKVSPAKLKAPLLKSYKGAN